MPPKDPILRSLIICCSLSSHKTQVMAEAEREQRPLLEVEQSGRDPAFRYDHGASTTSASLGSEDEDVLQSAILAGLTTEEASHYINDRNLVTQVCS